MSSYDIDCVCYHCYVAKLASNVGQVVLTILASNVGQVVLTIWLAMWDSITRTLSSLCMCEFGCHSYYCIEETSKDILNCGLWKPWIIHHEDTIVLMMYHHIPGITNSHAVPLSTYRSNT